MIMRIALTVGILLVGASSAAAWERPLFDFRGEFPVPGGTMRWGTQCVREAEGVRCRAESLGPRGRGFQFEGRLLLWPQGPTVTTEPGSPRALQTAPRWF